MRTDPGTPSVFHVRFHPPQQGELDPAVYELLLDLLQDITPTVQALPPDAAYADVSGALNYFGTDPAGLSAMIRARALALHGTDTTTGVAANPLLARLAARALPPGGLRILLPGQAAAFLAPQPPITLPGIGPAAARTLAHLGLTTIGRTAATPLPTLQRALGTAAGQRLHQHAHGIDRTPVVPGRPQPALTAEHTFDRDELDQTVQRATLLHLAHELGSALRTREQVAASLTLTVRYADQATTTRTRRLPEATAHSPALSEAAYRLHTALGLQRARVRGIALRVDQISPADQSSQQLTLDGTTDRARRREAAADRARLRFGKDAVVPAATRMRP